MDVIYQVLDKHQGDKPKAAAEWDRAKTLYNKLNSDQGTRRRLSLFSRRVTEQLPKLLVGPQRLLYHVWYRRQPERSSTLRR